MKQSDAIQLLYRDLTIVTSDLCSENYDLIFEEEIQEYFPFSESIMDWLCNLYSGEKYAAFDEEKLSLYYEKDHPFLFIRDLAHLNSWNKGQHRSERQDHITGLMFSGRITYALEATFSLCRPSLIGAKTSQWFDFKQAMSNLEKVDPSDWTHEAWKACSLFFLYFHLSPTGDSVSREELAELMQPYMLTLETALYEGSQALRIECGLVTRALRSTDTQTIFDGLNL